MDRKKKNYETEWSFQFDKIGEKIRDRINAVKAEYDDETPDVEVKFASFSEAVGERELASVQVAYQVGRLNVGALVASENLIEADVNYVGEVEFLVSEAPEYDVVLRQTGQPFTRSPRHAWHAVTKDGERDQLRWDLRLNPDVPLQLNVAGGMGRAEVDLRGLTISKFDMETGLGSTSIHLPDSDTLYDADIETGAGEVTLTLPQRANANIDITGGLGRVRLIVPDGAAVRLSAQVGLGKLDVPAPFEQQSRSSHFIGGQGVWETPDYDSAEHQIEVTFEGGIGKLDVVFEKVTV